MPVDVERVRLICFDVDGTLSDTDDQYLRRLMPWIKPLARLLRRQPENLARGIVYRMEAPGALLIETLDNLGLNSTANRLSEWLDRMISRRRKPSFLMIEGVEEMLYRLSTRYQLAVVSARGQRKTLKFLNYFNLTDLFSAIATGQTCSRTKPHPDPVLWVANQVGVAPDQCLVVGDTTADIRAGKAAGAQTVGVLCGFGQQEELLRAGADLILPVTTDLLTLFR